MGGAKKKSLAQAEKQQKMQTEKQTKNPAKTTKGKTTEKSTSSPTKNSSEFDLKELAKMKAITTYAVASRYTLKMSAAREILTNLEKNKTIQQISSDRGFKIFKFVGNA